MKDKVINDLLSRIATLEYEVERLNENNQAMQEEMARTWKKLDEKENIIKEVREYIDKAELGEDTEGDIVYLKDDLCGVELLEILDKGE